MKGKLVKHVFLTVLAMTLLAACLFGCEGSSRGGEETKTVRINISSEPDSLDPWQSAASDTEAIFRNVFEGLLGFDAQGDLTPSLAESWDVSGDGLAYTFHLRQGVVFHNGKKFTSADALYTYGRLTGLDGGEALSGKFSMVSALDAPDDETFVVTLSQPSASFLSLCINAVLPEGYEEQSTHPVGTGPFRFVEYTPSQRVVLEKNPDYYRTDDNGGDFVKIDRVEVYIMSDQAAVVSALRSGQLDVATVLRAEDAAALEDEYDVYNSGQNMVQLLALNNAAAPFDDERVRRAVNYAVDKDELIAGVFEGYASRLDSAFSPMMPTFHNGDLGDYYPTDVEKARALLAEAGYEDGFTFTLTVPANYPTHINTAQVIAQQLSKAGVTAKIETMEWSTWLEQVYTNGQYEATIIGLSGKLDPDEILGRFKTGYSKNFFHFSDEEYDGLIDAAKTELDGEKRAEEYKRCQEILTEQAAAVFLTDPSLIVACRKDLKGFTFYPVTFYDFSALHYDN